MKKISFLLLLLLHSAFENISAQPSAIVSGEIKEAKQSSMSIIMDKNYLGRKPEMIGATLQSGKFAVTVFVDRSRIAEFEYAGGRLKIFMEPGDNLQINFTDDAKHSGTSITGKGAEENLFLSQFMDAFKNDFTDSSMNTKILSQTVDAFENEIFAMRKKQNDFFKSAVDKDKFSSGFNEYIQNFISYRYWSLMLSYPIINANSSQSILTVNPLPEAMLEGLEKISVSNESALICDTYKSFLNFYVTYFTSKLNGFNKFRDYSTSADHKLSFAREHLSLPIYNYWLARFLCDECQNLSQYILRKMVNELEQNDKMKMYLPAVYETCATSIAKKETKEKKDAVIGAKSKTDERYVAND
jgi:hypothetical protein